MSFVRRMPMHQAVHNNIWGVALECDGVKISSALSARCGDAFFTAPVVAFARQVVESTGPIVWCRWPTGSAQRRPSEPKLPAHGHLTA